MEQEPPCSQAALLWHGIELAKQRDLRSAAEVFKLATELYPKSYLGYDLLGKTYFHAGKKSEARENLRKAVQLNGHDVVAQRMAADIAAKSN